VEGICGVVGEAGFEEDVPDHIFAVYSCDIWIVCFGRRRIGGVEVGGMLRCW
jgi:hypothetical protein